LRVATIGAALSGNKGAASMIESLANRFGDQADTLSVLTTYPRDDVQSPHPAGAEVVGLPAWRLPLVDLPLAAAARGLARWPRLRRAVLRTHALRTLDDASVVADISGVSFVDDRGPKFHVYNGMLTALPLLLQTPVVKCSQAMGPFGARLNRVLARGLLPHVDRILGRGEHTMRHLTDLGLRNVEFAADLAFTLPHDKPLPDAIAADLAAQGGNRVVVMPSAVVDEWCRRRSIDYARVMADVLAEASSELGFSVVLVPHAYRASGKPRRMDDGRVCRAVAENLGSRCKVLVLDLDLSPAQLRSVISSGDLVITSRFHGMVAALASCTPALVVGWSHKYAEVLTQFTTKQIALDYAALDSPAQLMDAIRETWFRRHEIQADLTDRLPHVRAAAEVNFRALLDASARTS
jgi:polysaccharide pyruvyl transferase WcaK-like protein